MISKETNNPSIMLNLETSTMENFPKLSRKKHYKFKSSKISPINTINNSNHRSVKINNIKKR